MLLERVQELMQKHFDQIASDAEVAELSRLLIDRPEVADTFAKAARLNSSLHSYFAGDREIVIPEIVSS
jgi:hypothetical protein